jgi:thioredoxin reductase (NADPH)
MTPEILKHRLVILGSGPAGLTAAIYAARANLAPLLVHGPLAHGQLSTTTDVENFPGFPEGIMGPDLMIRMETQAKRFGTQFLVDTVTDVTLGGESHRLRTYSREIYCEALIIATGATPKYLGLDQEKELLGYGVSTCATCDGAFFREKIIMVVGGGDSACEEASFLTRFGSKVLMVHRRDELRASKIMQQRVLANPKIEMIWDSAVTDIQGTRQTGVTSVTLKNLKTDAISQVATDALFVAIGHTPNSALFQNQLKMDETGYLLHEPNLTTTSKPGVFVCGDVQDHVFRQAITAAGSGCMAAIEAERWLESQH